MITNVTPAGCIPPHRVTRPEQVDELAEQFLKHGWDRTRGALVGYRLGGKVQLLNGTHRHAAATVANNLAIPVSVVNLKDVENAWGDLDKWKKLMQLGDLS